MSINIKLLSLLGVLAFIVVVGVYVLRRQSQRLRLVQSSEGDVRFQSLTELTSDCYWEMDAEFRFTRLEGSMALSQGLISESDLGLACWDIPAFHLNQAQCDACRTTLQPQALFRGLELQRQLPSGDPCWIALSGSPCFDGKGVFTGYRGAGCDITRRKLDVQRIEQLAYFDELTSLPNRRSLAQHLKQALQALTNHPRHGALMFIDLDNFKTINDVQGRELGNVLLQQVAQRLTESVRDTDTVARIGSDEFVVLLNELSAYAGEATFQANGVGKAIMARLNQPYDILGQSFHSTPSIGVALFNDPLKSGEELLKRAEMAMSHAKTAGRNVMRFYDPDMEAAASELAALEAELRQGLQLGELRLHYQPVVDELSRLSGVEALVRWQHPKRGLLLPIEFIELAEKSGLIMPLGQWVLEAACQQLVSWSELETTRELSMAVNVSARQFHQPDFVTKLLDLLRRTQANPFRLKLELTERACCSLIWPMRCEK